MRNDLTLLAALPYGELHDDRTQGQVHRHDRWALQTSYGGLLLSWPPKREIPVSPQKVFSLPAKRAKSEIAVGFNMSSLTEKARMGLFARTIGRARATTKIGFANFAQNMN